MAPARHGRLDPAQLRQRAEERLAGQSSPSSRITGEAEVRRLIHELEVHQVELEIQNAELQAARDEVASLLDGYAELFDFAPVGYLTLTRDGSIHQANLTSAAILGFERAKLLGTSFPLLLDAGSRAPFQQFLADRFEGGGGASCDLALREGGPKPAWIRLEASPYAPLSDRTCRVAFVDITQRRYMEEELRRTEAQLHHVQKLESLGCLAAGIAHDINNVLAAILTMAQALKQDPMATTEPTRGLDIIERAALRGRDLVGRLTSFARKELREAEPINLNQLLQEEVHLLARTTLQKVTCHLDLEVEPPFVRGERGRLGGALMNLCANALDAMPHGGSLSLGTRRTPGSHVEITIRDTGTGMSPEVLARAMEPFYTTKPEGRGSGLGLAMAFATARAHGGILELHSELGQGTTAILRLPELTDPRDTLEGGATTEESAMPLTVLLVDDDPLIRESLPHLLGRLGHRVEVVATGPGALERLASGAAVDVVILDKSMPGMDGLETLARLRQDHPDLPVILATGDLQPSDEVLLLQLGGAHAIAKPFAVEDLNRALRRARS